MFVILSDKTICLTRGDVANIIVSASLQDGTLYEFKPGDIVCFRVFKKRDCNHIVILKKVHVEESTNSVTIRLTKADTSIGDTICKPVDYWYEVEVNPDTEPQTIVGYDEAGEKIFRLYPEGSEVV
jgi:hypothetical protein